MIVDVPCVGRQRRIRLKKQDFLKETYDDLVAKGFTFDDFMNNLRSRSGEK